MFHLFKVKKLAKLNHVLSRDTYRGAKTMEKSNGMIHESGSREGARECYQVPSKAVYFPGFSKSEHRKRMV